MRHEFGKVAVMLGGDSSERPVSLKSGAAVLDALRAAGVDAHAFDPSEKPLTLLREEGFSRAFIALHGHGGEDGTLQGALDLMKIPYTGSGVLASALAMDKWRTKLIWQAAGIPVPDYTVLDSRNPHPDYAAVERQLGLPVFVKPASEGSSIGISKVKKADELPVAVSAAAQYDRLVIVERFVDAGEYTIGIIESGGRLRALPMIQIVPAGEYYDYDAKYVSDQTRYLCPCNLPEARQRELGDLALKAFALLGGRGWGRVDLMLDKQDNPYFLEVNTAPGMTDHSLVPMAARAAGIDFRDLVVQILEGAQFG